MMGIKNLQCRRAPTEDDADWFMRTVFGSSFDGIVSFLTGSVAFGEATGNSDIDIAFPHMSKEGIVATLKDNDVAFTESFYNAGVHIEIVRDPAILNINLIFLHPLDYVVWKRAGDVYRLMPRVSSREARHAQFESIRALIKTSFALAGLFVTAKNYHEYL